MKALLNNESPRHNGNTATALAEVAAQLQKNGIDSEIVWIGNKPVRGCTPTPGRGDEPWAPMHFFR